MKLQKARELDEEGDDNTVAVSTSKHGGLEDDPADDTLDAVSKEQEACVGSELSDRHSPSPSNLAVNESRVVGNELPGLCCLPPKKQVVGDDVVEQNAVSSAHNPLATTVLTPEEQFSNSCNYQATTKTEVECIIHQDEQATTGIEDGGVNDVEDITRKYLPLQSSVKPDTAVLSNLCDGVGVVPKGARNTDSSTSCGENSSSSSSEDDMSSEDSCFKVSESSMRQYPEERAEDPETVAASQNLADIVAGLEAQEDSCSREICGTNLSDSSIPPSPSPSHNSPTLQADRQTDVSQVFQHSEILPLQCEDNSLSSFSSSEDDVLPANTPRPTTPNSPPPAACPGDAVIMSQMFAGKRVEGGQSQPMEEDVNSVNPQAGRHSEFSDTGSLNAEPIRSQQYVSHLPSPLPPQPTPPYLSSQQHTPRPNITLHCLTPQHAISQPNPQQDTVCGSLMASPQNVTREVPDAHRPGLPQRTGPGDTVTTASCTRHSGRKAVCVTSSSGYPRPGQPVGVSAGNMCAATYTHVAERLGLVARTASVADFGTAGYTDCARQPPLQQNFQPQSMSFPHTVPHNRFMDMVGPGMNYSIGPMTSYSESLLAHAANNPTVCQHPGAVHLSNAHNVTQIIAGRGTGVLPCVVPGANVATGRYPPHGSLSKLQQLTNGILDVLPDTQLTPPPNVSPPACMNFPPSMIMRGIATSPASHHHQPMSVNPFISAGREGRQRPSSTAPVSSVTKSCSSTLTAANLTMNPNITFTPNISIQPPLQHYPMGVFNGYRVQQPMVSPSYINAGFLQLQPSQQVPAMQMMHVHPQHFQPQMQQHLGQTGVYPGYGYNLMNIRR